MDLQPNPGPGLPFTLPPALQSTTLLYSASPLVYGTGDGLSVGTGAPPQNVPSRNYFSGRSDNFDPNQNSGNPKDARLDSEGIRLSSDGRSVFISDEYGPYVYEFMRSSGQRIRAFRLRIISSFPTCSQLGLTKSPEIPTAAWPIKAWRASPLRQMARPWRRVAALTRQFTCGISGPTRKGPRRAASGIVQPPATMIPSP